MRTKTKSKFEVTYRKGEIIIKIENLNEANRIKKEIDELASFIWNAERTWTGKVIKRESKYIFKSMPYGVIESAEFNMNTEIKNKVLDVLKEHMENLKERLESI